MVTGMLQKTWNYNTQFTDIISSTLLSLSQSLLFVKEINRVMPNLGVSHTATKLSGVFVCSWSQDPKETTSSPTCFDSSVQYAQTSEGEKLSIH